jgi:Ribbon-helix-helix protein, copG family
MKMELEIDEDMLALIDEIALDSNISRDKVIENHLRDELNRLRELKIESDFQEKNLESVR